MREAFSPAVKAAQLSKSCGKFSKESPELSLCVRRANEGPDHWCPACGHSQALLSKGLEFLAAAPDPGWTSVSPRGL